MIEGTVFFKSKSDHDNFVSIDAVFKGEDWKKTFKRSSYKSTAPEISPRGSIVMRISVGA